MTPARSGATSLVRKPLRLWPGLVAAAAVLLLRFVAPFVAPDAVIFGLPIPMLGLLAGVAGGLVIVLWWALFSRARWSERLLVIVAMILTVAAIRPLLHESIAGAGMGMLFFFNAVASIGVALVAWAVASNRLFGRLRLATMVGAIVIGGAVWTLVRTSGVTGEGISDVHWRWTPTPEERLLAQTGLQPVTPPPTHDAAGERATTVAPPSAPPDSPAPLKPSTPDAGAKEPATPKATAARTGEWPGFRGPERDSVVRGVRIETDWTSSPPVELWRRPVGPGWSSFAVHGEYVYTQEQRGENELVSCYRLKTGEPVWSHADSVRFYESNGGAGPRATPTVYDGRIYTFGATGLVNALDAATGAVAWSRNAAADTGVKVPDWGFASSPLLVNGLVVIAASGRLVAYAAATGERKWLGPEGGAGYSSPHLATIDGVPQVLLLRGSRTISVAPADGTLLWEHSWEPGVGIVQPALVGDHDVLLTTGDAMGGVGMRRVSVAHTRDGWNVEERWTSRGLKPYFNDFVLHKGHAFGFDGSILSCIDTGNGERKWKGGRYGHGQLVLLGAQDLLLVLSEDGDLALVAARSDQFTEVARMKALEGKTWNHPVLAGDVLLVRNGEEMAAFRLSLVSDN